MRPIERVAMIGTGAVGASLAARIEDRLPGAITVLADESRIGTYGRKGFVVNGIRRALPLSRPEPGDPPFDLIIVAVKHHHLPEAIRTMAPAVGPDTLILSLMNGITSEDSLAAAFGRERVPYGMIIGIDALRQDREVRYTSLGTVNFGEARNGPERSPRVARIADFFDRADIEYAIPPDMLRTLWFKFMVNAGINQASAVLRAPYGFFVENSEARRVMEAGMREVVALSEAMGTGLTEADIGVWNAKLPHFSPSGKTSMLQDMEAGRKTEVEMLAGTVVKLASAAGIPVPVNSLWLDVIRAMEELSRRP